MNVWGLGLRHGVEQTYGRTFRIYSFDGRRAAGHGGCLGASFDVLLDDNLVAGWHLKTHRTQYPLN